MKKLIALALVLVTLLALCAPAFADYYPTATFKAGYKNQYVKYGRYLTMKYNYNSGTGPFTWFYNSYYQKKYRAGLTVYASKGSWSKKMDDWDFSGKGVITETYSTKTYFKKPVKKGISKADKLTIKLTSWYRPTYGNTVYSFRQYKTVKTKVYHWR